MDCWKEFFFLTVCQVFFVIADPRVASSCTVGKSNRTCLPQSQTMPDLPVCTEETISSFCSIKQIHRRLG